MSNSALKIRLAILPNGEAIDPSLVKAVLIEPGLGLATDMNERFDVCILFYDSKTRSVAKVLFAKMRNAFHGSAQERSTTPESAAAPDSDRPEDEDHASRLVAICILGLAPRAIKNVVETTHAECIAGNKIPLIITDSPHLARFVPWGMRVELVSDVDKGKMRLPDFAWSRYRADQFELIGRRWRPAQIVTFGHRPPEVCLAALRRGALRPL